MVSAIRKFSKAFYQSVDWNATHSIHWTFSKASYLFVD